MKVTYFINNQKYFGIDFKQFKLGLLKVLNHISNKGPKGASITDVQKLILSVFTYIDKKKEN